MSTESQGCGTLMSTESQGYGTLMSTESQGCGTLMSTVVKVDLAFSSLETVGVQRALSLRSCLKHGYMTSKSATFRESWAAS